MTTQPETIGHCAAIVLPERRGPTRAPEATTTPEAIRAACIEMLEAEADQRMVIARTPKLESYKADKAEIDACHIRRTIEILRRAGG